MRMNHYKLPAGVQDLLPEEYYNVSLLTEKLKNKFRLAGCRFLESSAVEYYDTFAEIRNRIPAASDVQDDGRRRLAVGAPPRHDARGGADGGDEAQSPFGSLRVRFGGLEQRGRRRETCPAADTCRRAWNFWA